MSKWGVYLMSLSIILFPSLSCPTNIQVEVAYSTRSCDFRYEEVDSECPVPARKLTPSGWKQCFNQCCSSVGLANEKDKIDLIVQCQSANNKKTLILIILLSTLLPAALISAAAILICVNKKSCPLYQYLKGKTEKYERGKGLDDNSKDIMLQNIARAIVEKVEERESTLQEIAEPHLKQTYKITYESHKNITMMQSKCIICLSARSTCELNCRHYFHIKCLGLWFERGNPQAPCGDTHIRAVWVHCENCMNEVASFSLHKFKSKFRKGKSFLCAACRKI